MNGHKGEFRLYTAGKINTMDNKLLYDHLTCHDMDNFHVCIAVMFHVAKILNLNMMNSSAEKNVNASGIWVP